MNKEYKQEIIDFINKNNLNDIFTIEDKFYNNYNCHLYVYIRVSTESQDFGRQILELHKWAKIKNITICIDYIFCDKFTGKSIKRPAYIELKNKIKSKDYLITTNLSRLGRNWDSIKKEWNELEYNNINRIILDNANLSVELPNEEQKEMNFTRKFIQDISFSACLYSACTKIQEVKDSTKAGLEKAKLNGKILGKPKGKYNTKENFIKTLEYMIEKNVGQDKACLMCKFPTMSFKNILKKCYIKYNTKAYKEILNKIKEEKTEWELF